MLERFNPVLRIVCLALAGLVLFQLSRIIARKDPLANLNLTALSLPSSAEANAETKGTNSVPKATNVASATNTFPKTTNVISGTNAVRTTNTVYRIASAVSMRPSAGAMKAADLPPAVQARVDRITQSEILGPIVRPLPMALLGIAGKDVFLRAPNGQTGMIREGEELGGVKLIRIGVNRVLIEHEQQQKELTVFSGFGSETLLPKGEKNTP